MPIIVKENKGSRKQLPAGTYVARCIGMIHIGIVRDVYEGQEKILNKVRITWELPTELEVFNENKGEQPYTLSKEYTLSFHEKSKLREHLKSWRGKDFTEQELKGFDIENLLGKTCMLSVGVKDGSVYPEINGLSPLVKGLEVPPQINETTLLTYDNFDYAVFAKLPDFIKDKMMKTDEFIAMSQANAMQDSMEQFNTSDSGFTYKNK